MRSIRASVGIRTIRSFYHKPKHGIKFLEQSMESHKSSPEDPFLSPLNMTKIAGAGMKVA